MCLTRSSGIKVRPVGQKREERRYCKGSKRLGGTARSSGTKGRRQRRAEYRSRFLGVLNRHRAAKLSRSRDSSTQAGNSVTTKHITYGTELLSGSLRLRKVRLQSL